MVDVSIQQDHLYETFKITEDQCDYLHDLIDKYLDEIDKERIPVCSDGIISTFLSFARTEQEQAYCLYQAGIFQQICNQIEENLKLAEGN
jgi:hypothetical protein